MDITFFTITSSTSFQLQLFTQYLEMRRAVFKEKMSWDLQNENAMEFDQYDNPHATYVIAHEGDTVLGGGRILCTTARVATGVTYMLRDAAEGHLDGLPNNLLFDAPPVDETVYELSRLVSERPGVGMAMMVAINDHLYAKGGKECLSLSRLGLYKLTKSLGMPVKYVGPKTGNSTGRFVAFSTTLVPKNQRIDPQASPDKTAH